MNAMRFLKDRISIGRTAKVSALTPKQARATIREHLDRLEGMLEHDFLFGGSPCIADFSAYHGLWYVRDLAEQKVMKGYPKVNAWMDRVQAFGHGSAVTISQDEALAQARDAEPRAIGTPGKDPLLGKRVAIAPDDYARDPVIGTLAGSSEHESVLRLESEDLGVLHLHFPKQGFRLREA